MGRNALPASQVTGNHLSQTQKNLFAQKEKELVGDNDRLLQGIEGLDDVEAKRLINKGAKDLYDLLSKEASKSSALGNIHIHDLIDLANEYENLKKYNTAIKKYSVVVFDGIKFSPNPADKMRKDSLKVIRELKSFLGMSTVDIVAMARQRAEMNETDSLKNLFADGGSDEWED